MPINPFTSAGSSARAAAGHKARSGIPQGLPPYVTTTMVTTPSPDTGVSITECPGAMGPDITISYGDGRIKVTNKVKTTSDGKVVIKMMPANNSDNGVDYKTLDITLIGKNAESAWLTRTLNSTESASKKATICVDGKPEGEYEYIVVVPGVGMIDPRVEIEN